MFTSSNPKRRGVVAKAAILASALLLAAPLGMVSAEARAGGGSSFGSRGARTWSSPGFTNTAPRTASPIQRSESPSMGYGQQGGFANAAQPRRFGFGSGLAAGLLGAGLFGMLTGNGFFGGLGSIASLFGMLFQLALIAGLVMLALRFFANRNGRTATAGGPGFMGRMAQGGIGGMAGGGFGGGGGGNAGPAGGTPIDIGPQDYAAFEQRLGEIQDAYGREDLPALSRLATPEMVRYFGEDIEANRRRNVRNEVRGAKLLQGDLAEAWREGWAEYATVAMRFTAMDTTVDRGTGRVIEGNASVSTETTELWTFRRDRGAPWVLAAIQQAN